MIATAPIHRQKTRTMLPYPRFAAYTAYRILRNRFCPTPPLPPQPEASSSQLPPRKNPPTLTATPDMP